MNEWLRLELSHITLNISWVTFALAVGVLNHQRRPSTQLPCPEFELYLYLFWQGFVGHRTFWCRASFDCQPQHTLEVLGMPPSVTAFSHHCCWTTAGQSNWCCILISTHINNMTSFLGRLLHDDRNKQMRYVGLDQRPNLTAHYQNRPHSSTCVVPSRVDKFSPTTKHYEDSPKI